MLEGTYSLITERSLKSRITKIIKRLKNPTSTDLSADEQPSSEKA